MSKYLLLYILIFVSPIFGFHIHYRVHHNIHLSAASTEEPIGFIQKYKMYFPKENTLEVIEQLKKQEVQELFISKDYKELVSIDVTSSSSGETTSNIYDKYHVTNINPIEVQGIVNSAYDNHIPVHFTDLSSYSSIQTQFDGLLNGLFTIANIAIPLFFLIYFIRLVTSYRQNNGFPSSASSMNIMNSPRGNNNIFGKNEKTNMQTPNISLSSWHGSPEVLTECQEVVSYLDNKNLFEATGAEIPKGILLEGPPGTGKTLLAKGIASETNSTFITMSGSQFVELFVGMGAAKVRELFQTARENTPCIVFIDEIDAIGKKRGNGLALAANDEREQTLNQILYEMDGFNNNEGLLILAATNRKDVLDKALLRPGRFDRIIRVPLPDKHSRMKILEYYCLKKKISPDVDLLSLSEITDGFSGAELKNLLNEAAILTAREKRKVIEEKDLFDSFEKLLVGLVKKNNDASLNTRRRVAIHESGHAIIALHYPELFDLQKVSIQQTYSGAGGYTIYTENPQIKENGLYTRAFLKKQLTIMLGGKAAETLYYGGENCSGGATQDLKNANQLAQQMIGLFGMAGADGILEVFYNENFGEDSLGYNRVSYSENIKMNIDKEVLKLLGEAYKESKRILREKEELFLGMTNLLIKKNVLNKKDIRHYFFTETKENGIK